MRRNEPTSPSRPSQPIHFGTAFKVCCTLAKPYLQLPAASVWLLSACSSVPFLNHSTLPNNELSSVSGGSQVEKLADKASSASRMDVVHRDTDKPASTLKKGQSLEIVVKTLNQSPMKTLCPQGTGSMSLKVFVEAFKGNNKVREHEIFFTHNPSKEGSFGHKPSISIALWNDPDAKVEDDPDSIEFRRYLFSFLNEAARFDLKVGSYINCAGGGQGKSIEFDPQTVTLDLSGAGLAEFESMMQAHQNRLAADNRMARPAMKNPALESKFRALLKEKDFDVSRVVITDPDWNMRKNALGVVTDRTIHAQVAYKTNKGGYKVGEAAFEEPKLANGWGPTRYAGWGTGEFDILEANINK